MNNHERDERRKLNERREDQRQYLANLPDINRAHRDCERECIALKARMKLAESLLASAGIELQFLCGYSDGYDEEIELNTTRLIADIDAFLPATEVDKYNPQTKLSQEYE